MCDSELDNYGVFFSGQAEDLGQDTTTKEDVVAAWNKFYGPASTYQ